MTYRLKLVMSKTYNLIYYSFMNLMLPFSGIKFCYQMFANHISRLYISEKLMHKHIIPLHNSNLTQKLSFQSNDLHKNNT